MFLRTNLLECYFLNLAYVIVNGRVEIDDVNFISQTLIYGSNFAWQKQVKKSAVSRYNRPTNITSVHKMQAQIITSIILDGFGSKVGEYFAPNADFTFTTCNEWSTWHSVGYVE